MDASGSVDKANIKGVGEHPWWVPLPMRTTPEQKLLILTLATGPAYNRFIKSKKY